MIFAQFTPTEDSPKPEVTNKCLQENDGSKYFEFNETHLWKCIFKCCLNRWIYWLLINIHFIYVLYRPKACIPYIFLIVFKRYCLNDFNVSAKYIIQRNWTITVAPRPEGSLLTFAIGYPFRIDRNLNIIPACTTCWGQPLSVVAYWFRYLSLLRTMSARRSPKNRQRKRKKKRTVNTFIPLVEPTRPAAYSKVVIGSPRRFSNF